MNWLVWQLPGWMHTIINRVTGYRLVAYYVDPDPDMKRLQWVSDDDYRGHRY